MAVFMVRVSVSVLASNKPSLSLLKYYVGKASCVSVNRSCFPSVCGLVTMLLAPLYENLTCLHC